MIIPPGYEWQQLKETALYMESKGFSASAAAGVAGTVAGESLGDADAQGTGGRGLIGWTPAGTLPNYAFTGNEIADFRSQLPLVAHYYATANPAEYQAFKHFRGSPVAAADIASQDFERPGIKDSDVRPVVANTIYRWISVGRYYDSPFH